MAKLQNFLLYGVSVWCDPDDMASGGDFFLAPDEHVTDSELNRLAHTELSYAHYSPTQGIMRFGEKIGDRSDLVPVGTAAFAPRPSRIPS